MFIRHRNVTLSGGSAIWSLGSFLLLQLFFQLGDMFISDCFLQVLWTHTSILILHFLCEHLYPGTQLVNHLPQLTDSLITIKCINYSESLKSVLRQETVCIFCWLCDNAPNVIVILGASVCPGVGCYHLVLLSLGKPLPKMFSIVIYASPLIYGVYP